MLKGWKSQVRPNFAGFDSSGILISRRRSGAGGSANAGRTAPPRLAHKEYLCSQTPVRFWISEGLAQADTQFKGVEFSCP